jgi:hypothetical protein
MGGGCGGRDRDLVVARTKWGGIGGEQREEQERKGWRDTKACQPCVTLFTTYLSFAPLDIGYCTFPCALVLPELNAMQNRHSLARASERFSISFLGQENIASLVRLSCFIL